MYSGKETNIRRLCGGGQTGPIRAARLALAGVLPAWSNGV